MKSVRVRPIVGNAAIASLETFVAAPVRVELKVPTSPVTVMTCSVVAVTVIAKSRSVRTPRSRKRSSCTLGARPMPRTDTVYGPPTRTAGMV